MTDKRRPPKILW